jgi:hypothetical protein
VLLDEVQGLIDRFHPDVPWMIPNGRIDESCVFLTEGENRSIRIQCHPNTNDGDNSRGLGLGNDGPYVVDFIKMGMAVNEHNCPPGRTPQVFYRTQFHYANVVISMSWW